MKKNFFLSFDPKALFMYFFHLYSHIYMMKKNYFHFCIRKDMEFILNPKVFIISYKEEETKKQQTE